jgi:hypothetical protein
VPLLESIGERQKALVDPAMLPNVPVPMTLPRPLASHDVEPDAMRLP